MSPWAISLAPGHRSCRGVDVEYLVLGDAFVVLGRDQRGAGGAEGVLARLRAAEGSGPAAPDDASIGYPDLDSSGWG